MKKILCLILTVLMLIPLLVGCGSQTQQTFDNGLLYATFKEYEAASKHLHPETDDNLRYALYNNFVQVIECISTNADIVIPDTYPVNVNGTVKNLPVISIRAGAFQDNTSLKHLTIGANVLQIGADAFAGCTSLTQVKMSDSVNEIGSDAFAGCTKLNSIVIPPKVNTILSGTFSNCGALTKVIVESMETQKKVTGRGETEEVKVTRVMESGVFSNCPRLAIMWIPEDVTTVTDSILGGTTPKPLICGGDATASSWFATLQCLDYELVSRSQFDAHARLYNETLEIEKSYIGESTRCNNMTVTLTDVSEYEKLGSYTTDDNHILIAAKFRIDNNTQIPQYFDGLNVTCKCTGPNRDNLMEEFTKLPLMLSPEVLGVGYPVGSIPSNTSIEGVIVLRVSDRYQSATIQFDGADNPFII